MKLPTAFVLSVCTATTLSLATSAHAEDTSFGQTVEEQEASRVANEGVASAAAAVKEECGNASFNATIDWRNVEKLLAPKVLEKLGRTRANAISVLGSTGLEAVTALKEICANENYAAYKKAIAKYTSLTLTPSYTKVISSAAAKKMSHKAKALAVTFDIFVSSGGEELEQWRKSL